MKDQELNVFGEPHDDIKQALYSSWADAENALCILQRVMAQHQHDWELRLELREVKDWAQAAAEMSHP